MMVLSERFWKPLLGSLALTMILASPVIAGDALKAGVRPAPTSRTLEEIDRLITPDLDREALRQEDDWRQEQGLPERFALAYDTQLNPGNSGTWEDLPGGFRCWRLRVANPGALSLNLGFVRYWLPADARLLVYPVPEPGAEAIDPQHETPGVVFDARDNADHGELWTPVLLGDELVVELIVPSYAQDDVDLELGQVNRGYRFYGEDKSGTCNIDVICPEGDGWRDEIRTVARITVRGITNCTGFMVNNTAGDARPLLMTADHCGLAANNAASLVVYWNFESPVCGSQSGGSLVMNQTGAFFLASYPSEPTPGVFGSDFTLVELDSDPDPDYEVVFAGWDRSMADPDSAVAIHHPSGDEKSISFEFDPLTTTSYLSNSSPGNGTHLRVTDWDLGTTEGGSSGSPLFDQNHRVVGQLHGGAADCANDASDWYGRFSVSWEGGGTSDTRLRDHLDPVNSGVTVLDLFDPKAAAFTVSPLTGISAWGEVGGPFDPESIRFVLSNSGILDVEYSITTTANWIDLSQSQGMLAVGDTTGVVVGFNAETSQLPVGRHVAEVRFTNEFHGPGDTTRQIVLDVVAPQFDVLGPAPNPFTDLTEIHFTLANAGSVRVRVMNVRGLLVADLGEFAGQPGLNTWPWTGRNQQGRRLPSGLYFVEMKSGGVTERVNLTLVR